MQPDVVRQRPSGGTPNARGFVWFLARLAHKDVEGFRVDVVLLGGEIVTCGRPLQHSPETLHLLFGHSRLMANRSKISLKFVDPLCSLGAPLRQRDFRSRDLSNFPQHLLSNDAGHAFAPLPGLPPDSLAPDG